MAHRESDGVAAGDVTVLLTGVELVLLLVEAVHEVLGAAARQTAALRHPMSRERTGRWARRISGLDVVVDRERPVGERAVESGPRGGIRAGARQRRRRGQVH